MYGILIVASIALSLIFIFRDFSQNLFPWPFSDFPWPLKFPFSSFPWPVGTSLIVSECYAAVLFVWQENSKIRELQSENLELRQSLSDHQSALEVIMTKYREQLASLARANHVERTLLQRSATRPEVVWSFVFSFPFYLAGLASVPGWVFLLFLF